MEPSGKDVESLYDQAKRYLQGDGVPLSYEKGLPHLRQAADLGQAKALQSSKCPRDCSDDNQPTSVKNFD